MCLTKIKWLDAFVTTSASSRVCTLHTMSKRIRILTPTDVATHNTASSCWVSRAGKVYDVSQFLNDHPGGDDLILAYAGKDVEEAMKDKLEHEHSESAYDMLDEYLVGRLGSGEETVSDGAYRVITIE